MYCPVRPVKVAMSRAICSGVKAMNWQTTSKERLPSPRIAVRRVHVAGDRLDALGQRRRWSGRD